VSWEELEELKEAEKVVGTRQTTRALEKGEVVKVFIAQDAEDKITSPVIEECKDKGIEISYVSSMSELGKACNIKVGAAMAAVVTK